MGNASFTPEILKRDYNLTPAKVARWLGVNPSMVSHVLHGRKKTHYIRRAIAKACGLAIDQIWPEEKAS